MAKQLKQVKAAGVLAVVDLGWPIVGLGWCSWPLRLVAWVRSLHELADQVGAQHSHGSCNWCSLSASSMQFLG